MKNQPVSAKIAAAMTKLAKSLYEATGIPFGTNCQMHPGMFEMYTIGTGMWQFPAFIWVEGKGDEIISATIGTSMDNKMKIAGGENFCEDFQLAVNELLACI